MNLITTKALVSTQSLIPAPKRIHRDAVCLDLYPKGYRNEVVFSICVPDEPDGKYGPNGRKLINPKYAKFIDIYV